MQLLFAKRVLNMEGNDASDICEHLPFYHGFGECGLSDQVTPIPVQDVVILFIVLVEERTMHSILWLLSSNNLRSNMQNEAGQILPNAEFTAGCSQPLPPQPENGLEQHAGCVGIVVFSG